MTGGGHIQTKTRKVGGGAHWVTYRNRIQKSWMGAQNQDIWTQQKKRAGGRLTPGDIHKHEKK